MNQDILLSIIIPVYNVEHYLAECLDSILCQTFCDYEIICIDDASTDNSYEIMQEYAHKNSQIKIQKNSANRGLSYTRNCGVREAHGKYIMFVDSDDMLKPNALEQLSQMFKRYRDIDILYYDMEVRNEGIWAKEQLEITSGKDFENVRKICTGQELFVQLQKNNTPIVEACRQIIRRSFLSENEIEFYEGIYHEDNLFSFFCALNAKRVVYVPEAFYIYRRRDASIMSTMNLKRVQSYFVVFIELWNYWKNGDWTEEVNWLFEDFLNDIYKQFINRVNYYPDEELIQFGRPADQFMYKVMANNHVQSYEYVTCDERLISEAKKATSIIVYGAGNVGIEVVRLLQSRNVAIDRILVSDKRSNPDEILGVAISEFGECKIAEDTLIIIAILKSNEKAIEKVTENIRKSTRAKLMMYDGTFLN